MGAGDDFDESGLTCAVFAEEGVDFTRLQVKRNAFQSADGAKRFGDLVELEEGVQRASNTSFSYFLIIGSQASATGTDLESQ